jgi:hypothetical protein
MALEHFLSKNFDDAVPVPTGTLNSPRKNQPPISQFSPLAYNEAPVASFVEDSDGSFAYI